jgi:transcriptional regulator GlxA family with amidase domain
MFARAARGLKFSDETARIVRPTIEALYEQPPAARVLDLISILVTVSADVEAESLAAPTAMPVVPVANGSRIDKVLEHVHANYHGMLKVETLAEIAALSTSAFHRMFLRQTRSTLTGYVMRLRIGEACAQLIADDRQIAAIAESVGYRSLANFGRQFRALKRQTPREYRNRFSLEPTVS